MRGHGALLVPLALLTTTIGPTRIAGAADPRPPVEVGGARAVAGEKVRGALKVADAADGTPIVLPLTIAAGRKPGPVAWVQAATHGDEYGGARALQEVVRGLDLGAMSGTLIAVMIANPPAFQGLSRVNPNWDDLMDSGDAFPGKDRFATERIAAAIHDAVRKNADFFVDMHTGGDRFRQHPFVLYSVAAGPETERLDGLARGFGVPTLWRDTVKIFPTSASTVFSGEGIPGFLLEVGGGQPLDPADVRLQAEAIRSFLRAAGILPGPAARLKSYAVVSGYRIVTNGRGGFFDAAVKPGDRVKEGAILGTITDVHGDVVETMRAPAGSDIVLGVSTYPATPTGGWLLELGSGLAESP